MKINIIRGGIGSGKSDKCAAMIASLHSKNPNAKCIMLVPNHNSYDTEKSFVEKFGGTGLNNIEVMTLRRLSTTLLNNRELNYITESGKRMLIRKSIMRYCSENEDTCDRRLLAAIKKSGFTDVTASLISEFKRYMITPDMLEEKAPNADATLGNKMLAAAGICRIYSEYMENSGYTDSEDDNTRLAEHIAAGDYFNENTFIWIDKFNDLTPQQTEVLRAAAKSGAHLTISVSYPSEKTAVYEPMKTTMSRIDELTDEFGMGEITDTGTDFKRRKSAETEFLLKNWGLSDSVWEKKTDDIVYFSARDIYNEVETAACKITDLVREGKMRYRDIAILCGDTNEYNHIIETVFAEYKIPCFTDRTLTLSDHPIAMQILSVFDIFEKDWCYEDVFRYLKSGFIYTEDEINGKKFIKPFDTEKLDFLENYVLKHGIRGKKRWLSEWQKASGVLDAAFDTKKSEDAENYDTAADEIRREAVRPLASLTEKVRGKNTAEHFSRAIFDFMRDINLADGLKHEISAMQKNGEINEADRFAKLWNLMLDVLHQTVVVLGNETLTFSEYGEYISAGLSACEIRTIPSGIDQVYVGNVEKSSAREVKALFVMGANDGTFPDIIPKEGYFSNADRNFLSENLGIMIAPDSKKKLEKQYFKVYSAMCAVSEKLFLSRPLQNSDGKALTKSPMITDIEQLFPNMRSVSADKLNGEKLYISTPEATIHKMLINKSANTKARKNPIWDAAYDWFSEKDEWKRLVSLIDRTKWYMYSDIHLDKELADKLYGKKTAYSASRLNTFARCPFGYYMQYGLRLKEREVWDITPADVGSYAHEVIRRFCAGVEDGASEDSEKVEAWLNLTDERRVKLLDSIIDETCENMLNNNIRDKEKTANILRRTGKNIHNAAITVHRALSSGRYVQNGMECEFNMPITEDIEMRGIIDRVDMYSSGNEIKLRIVDYKTGSTSFDVVNIANGIDMQMVIYAIAARESAAQESGKRVRITGIYYNRVHNKSVTVPLLGGEETARADAEKELMLDGITFTVSDSDLFEADRHLSENGRSDFLNVKLNKDGTVRSSKNVRPAAAIEGLSNKVKENIIKIDKGIKSGNISCTPYKDGTLSACEYCAYGEICSFGNNKIPREKIGSAEAVWEEMSKKEADDNGDKLDR